MSAPINMLRSRGNQEKVYISAIMHHFLFFSKIESGNLYLKNYYQNCGLQIFKTQKNGYFFSKIHFNGSTDNKYKKNR